MCCKSLWKGIIAFCLTFLLGLFTANLLAPFVSVLPSVEVKEEKLITEKDNFEKRESTHESEKRKLVGEFQKNKKICVPANEEFKYNLVNYSEKVNSPQTEDHWNISPEVRKRVREIEKRIQEVEKSLKSSSKQLPMQNLLYTEKCYEVNGRKRSAKINR